ncbi:hypothetical protein CERZMDRAFT_3033, partial [Cercospora zeae-maydis SCOH1-5]
GNQVCAPCLRRIFELALQDRTSWPPRWGRQRLDYRDFRDMLDNHTLRRLDERCREERCPVAERVYCRQMRGDGECGTFIGGRSDAEAVCGLCSRCGQYTCLRCSTSFRYARDERSNMSTRHQCQLPTQSGKDYQNCPDCGQRVQLADGCNHITCICGEQFCYLC